MKTIKAYTDLSQSKKLAEILPLESADMRYGYIAPYDYSDRMYDGGYDEIPYPKDFLIKNPNFSANEYNSELPCWSLAALLSVLPKFGAEEPMIRKLYYANEPKERYICEYSLTNITSEYDNPVDACYEMILMLHELKML